MISLTYALKKLRKKIIQTTFYAMLYLQCGSLYLKWCFDWRLGWSVGKANASLPNQGKAITAFRVLRFLCILRSLGYN